MGTFRNLRVIAAILFFAVSAWSQTPQEIVYNSAGLIAAIERFNTGNTNMNIVVGADFEITQRTINNEGRTLTIMSATSTPRTLNRETTASLFKVQKGTLILQNITIDGKSKNLYEAPFLNEALIFVTGSSPTSGGTLNMKAGTTLKNNTISGSNGGGVYVDSYGTFNMSGGEITGNKTDLSGGGVYIYALRATFNMTGGKITGNECGTSATSYSGGVHFANSPFSTDKNTDKTVSVFKVGGTAVIKDNYKKNGTPSNVYMAGSRYITLNPPLNDEMEIWVTKVAESGLFVNAGANSGDVKYFEADEGSQIFYEAVGKLKMVAGYDIDLSKTDVKFTALSGYSASEPAEYEIEVTNIGKTLGHLRAYTSGEHAGDFVLDTMKLGGTMNQNAVQKFKVKPKAGLVAGVYKAFILVSAQIGNEEGGPAVMRRIEVEFTVSDQFKFEVTVAAGSLGFDIPLSGMLDNIWNKPYNWNIDWGDGKTETKINTADGASPNGSASPGISHTYAAAGKYTITITSAGSPDAWLGAFGFNNGNSGANAATNKAKITKLITPFTPLMTRTQEQINGTLLLLPTYEWAYAFYGCKNMVIGENFKFPNLSKDDIDREGVLYATFAGITADQDSDIFSIIPNTSYQSPQTAKYTFAGSTGFWRQEFISAQWGGNVVGDTEQLKMKVEEFETFFTDLPNYDVTARIFTSFTINEPFSISRTGTFTIESDAYIKQELKRGFDEVLFTATGNAELAFANIVIYDDNVSHSAQLVNVVKPFLMRSKAVLLGIGSNENDIYNGSYLNAGTNAVIIAWDGAKDTYDAYTDEGLNSAPSVEKLYWEKWGDGCKIYYKHGNGSEGHIIGVNMKCSEDRVLYFNQSDGKFYASDECYDYNINMHPPYVIFTPKNVVDIPNTAWHPETNRLTFSNSVGWKTTAPYALYFVQPTPVTLELENGKKSSFVSTRAPAGNTDYNAGIVSRSNLTIVGDGNLEAEGGSADKSYGIYSQTGLTITMGNKTNTIETKGKSNGFNSAAGSLAINGGTFIASSETVALPNFSSAPLLYGNYDWHYSGNSDGTSATTVTTLYGYNATHKWLKFEIEPPNYAFYAAIAATSTYTPLINTEKVAVTLTRRDVKNKGDIDQGFSGSHKVDLTFVNASNVSRIINSATQQVTFDKGVGNYIDLTFNSTDSLILWFKVDDILAINPVIIIPVSERNYGISLYPPNPGTFTAVTKGYPQQEPLTITIINEGNQPTGLLMISELDKFTISRSKAPSDRLAPYMMPSIPVGGTATFQVTPKMNLPAGTYPATITVSGENEIEKSTTVSFTVMDKLPGEDVETPVLYVETANSIFIYAADPKPITGQEVEYAISKSNSKDGLAFVSFNEFLEILQFNDLERNTTYYIFARSKENAAYSAGKISDPLQVKTTFFDDICVEFDKIAIRLWSINGGPGNTMTVINNPYNNGDFKDLSDFVWIRNSGGIIDTLSKDQSWSAGKNGEQFPPGKYHVEMMVGRSQTEDGFFLKSCEYIVEYPPITQESSAMDWNNVESAEVYSISGKHLAKISTVAELRPIKNAYVLVIKTKTGAKQTIKATEALR